MAVFWVSIIVLGAIYLGPKSPLITAYLPWRFAIISRSHFRNFSSSTA